MCCTRRSIFQYEIVTMSNLGKGNGFLRTHINGVHVARVTMSPGLRLRFLRCIFMSNLLYASASQSIVTTARALNTCSQGAGNYADHLSASANPSPYILTWTGHIQLRRHSFRISMKGSCKRDIQCMSDSAGLDHRQWRGEGRLHVGFFAVVLQSPFLISTFGGLL